MRLVGVTGGMGSGKSTVAARCREHDVPVIDADAVAREVVEPGQPALAELAARFGDDVLRADGTLDRAELARRAFADADGRDALDAITHPRIAARLRDRVAALRDAHPPPALVVLDHPLLLETGTAALVDEVVVVLADVDTRVARLVEQRGLDEGDARARIAAQTDDAARRAQADHVLTNDGPRDELVAATDALLERLRSAGPGTAAARW